MKVTETKKYSFKHVDVAYVLPLKYFSQQIQEIVKRVYKKWLNEDIREETIVYYHYHEDHSLQILIGPYEYGYSITIEDVSVMD